MCRCAYPQGILVLSFFLGAMLLFQLRNLTQMRDTTQNSSSAQLHWNRSTDLVTLCSNERHNVEICIFTGNADLIFLRSNLIYPFWTSAKIILCNSDETGFLSDCPSVVLVIICYSLFTAFSSYVEARGVWACSLFLCVKVQ